MTRTSRRTRTPLPVLLLLLFCSGLLVPLFLSGASEDGDLTETATARVLPGGESVPGGNRGGGPTCRDAPVTFRAGAREVTEVGPVKGIECPTRGSVEVEVRYDPDDPSDFTTLDSQTNWYYVLAAAAAGGFLLCLVALLRRIVSRLRRGRA